MFGEYSQDKNSIEVASAGVASPEIKKLKSSPMDCEKSSSSFPSASLDGESLFVSAAAVVATVGLATLACASTLPCSAGDDVAAEAHASGATSQPPSAPSSLDAASASDVQSLQRRSSADVAALAERRALDAASRGIGDMDLVREKRARQLQQEERGTSDCFGASRASALRARVEARRRGDEVQLCSPVGQSSSASVTSSTADGSAHPLLLCSAGVHVCVKDAVRGCASCNYTCHADCTSTLCALQPCASCLSLHITTHTNSALCREVQRCCSFHAPIHSLSDSLVCCPSCDSSDHLDNTDPLCPYYLRERVVHPDAVATGSAAPDMFERAPVTITKRAHEDLGTVHFSSGTRIFVKGYASGNGNNCLIDSLVQAIQMHFPEILVNITWIRSELQLRYPSSRPYAVTKTNFLDLRNHWEAVVDLILMNARAQGCMLPDDVSAASFQIISVQEDAQVVGDHVGTGPFHLYLLNQGFLHFLPLIRRLSL